jgi:menaquinol-cytochrome c reductase iron-sulfur subunit
MPDSQDEKPPNGASTVRTDESEDSRRAFLKTVGVGGLGVGLAVVVAAPAVPYVIYPLDHATVSGATGFIPIGKSEAFKDKPVKVDVFTDKRDAWNRLLNVKVGSVWILRDGDKLRAFSTVCPHLGCGVDYEADTTKFRCPCHQSIFAIDGKAETGPSPRGMDELELAEKDGVVSVRYQRFKVGSKDKELST